MTLSIGKPAGFNRHPGVNKVTDARHLDSIAGWLYCRGWSARYTPAVEVALYFFGTLCRGLHHATST